MHLDGSEGDFFRKDISEDLRKYITGISYPAEEQTDIDISDLDYVHIKYMDFEGNPANGELICNKYISEDLIYIFSKLYENDYRIEKVRLIDEYDGDDDLSMADNNSSCFNYRNIVGTKTLSKHSLGLAIDINPLYNPYITFNDDGTSNIYPKGSEGYADRSKDFPYKIDENDLCYKLFTERGFTWGGNWNSSKDYQHFQKTKP
ncbi:MAG: M15 family metallopeptidase [Acetatifactor sp.]|nr:M15 family metallopeptidase [Acetatifactor sp.]